MPTRDRRLVYLTRNNVMSLLSGEESARVSQSESLGLVDGEEYLDLEHLDHGVRRVAAATRAGHALPRRAVNEDTWRKILTQLAAPRIARMYSGH
jgi:hypothetical protein